MQNATPFNYIFESGILVGGQGVLVGMQAPTYSWNALRAGAEFGQAGNSVGGYSDDAVSFLLAGLYQDTSLNWKYAVSDYGTALFIGNGMLQVYTAPSGTAGNAATLTERMRLTSAGVLGLNCVPNTAWGGSGSAINLGSDKLAVAAGSQIGLYMGAAYDGANWKYLDSTNKPTYCQIGYDGVFQIHQTPVGTAGNTVSTFNLVLSVQKGTSLALEGANTQAGTGITFPAAASLSSNANTLDDYEEGVITNLTLTGDGGSGVTYSVRECVYVKIGSQVCISGTIQLTSKGTMTGSVYLGGLPFTTTTAGTDVRAGGFVEYGSVGNLFLFTTAEGTTTCYLISGGTGLFGWTSMTNTSTMWFSLQYRTDQ